MCGVGGMHMWGGGAGAVLCSRLIRHVTSRTYIGERLGKFHGYVNYKITKILVVKASTPL